MKESDCFVSYCYENLSGNVVFVSCTISNVPELKAIDDVRIYISNKIEEWEQKNLAPNKHVSLLCVSRFPI